MRTTIRRSLPALPRGGSRPGTRLGLAALLALAGCAAGPNFQRPAAPADTRYLPRDEMPLAGPGETADGAAMHALNLRQPWWRHFGSAKLDALVEEALAHSPTLDAAQATLRQSQDSLRAGDAVFFPQVDAGLSLARQRVSPFRLGPSGATIPVFNLYTLGATISYTLDLFGASRREVEALRAQVDTQRYAAAAAYLTLTSTVVNAAVAQAAYAREVSLQQTVVRLETDQLAIARVQLDSGLIAESTFQAQAQQLEQTRATLEPLSQRLAQSRHLLSQLLGRSTAQDLPPLPALDELRLPPAPPLSVPSAWVRERPDILQAEAQWHVVCAELGVATAQMWPNVTLGADGGGENTRWTKLTTAQSRFWSVGPSLDVELFGAGRQTYQLHAAREAYKAAGDNYRQVVLNAFEQVADTLSALQHDARLETAQETTAQSAERNWHLARTNEAAGTQSRQDTQASEIAWHQSEINHAEAQAQRLQDSVALYAAMGGAWWTAGPPWLRPASGDAPSSPGDDPPPAGAPREVMP